MKHGKGVTTDFQNRNVEEMKFRANFQNIFTDEAIKAIQKAKEVIRNNQLELKNKQNMKRDN